MFMKKMRREINKRDLQLKYFLKLCRKEELPFVKKFLAEFIVANGYVADLVDLKILAKLKVTKNIETYVINNYTIKEIFNAIKNDDDKIYVIDTLANLLFDD